LRNGFAMDDKPEDSPTVGEQMNRALYLDPGFTQDKPNLLGALRDEIGDTVKRAQANVDQQRANQADIERLAKKMARERDANDLPDAP